MYRGLLSFRSSVLLSTCHLFFFLVNAGRQTTLGRIRKIAQPQCGWSLAWSLPTGYKLQRLNVNSDSGDTSSNTLVRPQVFTLGNYLTTVYERILILSFDMLTTFSIPSKGNLFPILAAYWDYWKPQTRLQTTRPNSRP
ncbi:hypothetical protein GGS26DRAFT_524496 [Hypomontagnella submonticulosa]|nr:hypothetical protein GGS26DRAFT_524496 [Hypomontagnella submonticulosa]